MYARVNSYGLAGLQGFPVQVEVDISSGLPAFDVVGLPDQAVKESKERVRSAIRNSGLAFPTQRVTVNLAPGDVKKEGPLYDLPIALGLLAAMEQVPLKALEGCVVVGELALEGRVRSVQGVLPMVLNARLQGAASAIVPADNGEEGACALQDGDSFTVTPVESLTELVSWLRGERQIAPAKPPPFEPIRSPAGDFSYIRGQHAAKRAIEIAAAGGHNMLMIGPPGSGKTMLARSLPTILPTLSREEAVEISKIHSIAGLMHNGLVRERPFRAPHHSASAAALTGGGSVPRPGEVSLSHLGVLFLDELPEFSRESLEALRQPLEDQQVTITRVRSALSFPASFMLIAAMNPCPCGFYGSTQPCRCSSGQLQRYMARVSGPLLDRIDIQIEVQPVTLAHLQKQAAEETSETVQRRVEQARVRQRARYRTMRTFFNAQLSDRQVREQCQIDEMGRALMEQAFNRLHLTARAYTRILKVARTIADLAGEEQIAVTHLAEAIQYRSLDRKYWS